MNPEQNTDCSSGWLISKYEPSICLWAALTIGTASALMGELLGNLSTGRQLNDPLMLALAIGILFRGFLYFPWLSFGITVFYAAFLGGVGHLFLKWLAGRSGRMVVREDAGRVAMAAALISTLPVVVREVDALQVMIWYGIATWLNMIIASFTARRLLKSPSLLA